MAPLTSAHDRLSRRTFVTGLAAAGLVGVAPSRSLVAAEQSFASGRNFELNLGYRNVNLTAPEKELLRWHYRLGHLGFKRVQFLMRTGVLARSEGQRRLHTSACKLDTTPLCAA